ncbi:MAG: hypothetical protein JW850_15420 [Thermoflexales bacterium]|nr:hypothetical protein [Thermoflexales bacterium]
MIAQKVKESSWVNALLAAMLVLAGLHGVEVAGSAHALPPVPPSSQPVVSVTGDGLIVEWHTPGHHIMPHDDGTLEVQITGYAQSSQAGAPRVPFAAALVAVPPGAELVLQVIETEEESLSLPGALALATEPDKVLRDAEGRPIRLAFSPASTFQQSSLSVLRVGTEDETEELTTPLVLQEVGILRGVRLARLAFYPLQSDSGGQTTRLITRLRASLTFAGRLPAEAQPAQPDPLLAAVRTLVINPADVQIANPSITLTTNRKSPRGVANRNTSRQIASTDPIAVEVSAPGLTAVTYEALAGAGFLAGSVDPHTVRLTRGGSEIELEWDGDDDASFEAGERLLFYADPRFSRWTANDVYFLDSDTSLGSRMQIRSADPGGLALGTAWVELTAEQNALYTPDCFCGSIPAGRDGDHWTWADVKNPGNPSSSYTINLPAIDTVQAAELRAWFIGYTDIQGLAPDHRIDVALNDQFLGRAEWDGKQAFTSTLTVPPGVLLDGDNTLTLNLPGIAGVEGAWLDAFSIRYARSSAPSGSSVIFTGQASPSSYQLGLSAVDGLRAYDVTNSDHPVRLSGVTANDNLVSLGDPAGGGVHRYAVAAATGVLSPTVLRPAYALQTGNSFAGADYLIIAPSALTPALGSLISLRSSQGLSVALEHVEAIYDAYDGGRPTPAAIRAYLAHAYANWMPRPVYVLLVGDGSSDPRLYRPNSTLTLIPPYLADVDLWAGETAADNRYVTLDGNDDLPDMLIGRLPVGTLAEAQTLVNKIVRYETEPFQGAWNDTVTFVADNQDPAGDFAAESEHLAALVPAPFTPQRIYYLPPTTTLSSIQQSVLGRWNAGALIVQYTGHSSWQQWAEERFFHLDDLPGLVNERREPIVLGMACFTGAFQRPEPTLDEELLKLNRGAIAAWSSTGLGISTGHQALAEGFYQDIFDGTPGTLGQATLAGKLSLAAGGQHLDLLNNFVLLGDPALRPNLTIIPWASQVYLPVVSRAGP